MTRASDNVTGCSSLITWASPDIRRNTRQRHKGGFGETAGIKRPQGTRDTGAGSCPGLHDQARHHLFRRTGLTVQADPIGNLEDPAFLRKPSQL